jgi:hypothetical protein
MKNIDFEKLIHAITYWMSYNERIGRNFMMQESSLKYPVADYLTGLGIPIENIDLEFSHPGLKSRRIDLITTNIPQSDKGFKIENAIEFKIASNNTKDDIEKERIFNDLMRMHLIYRSNNTSSYFVICGQQMDFIQHFRSLPKPKSGTMPTSPAIQALPSPQGFYTNWFSFRKNTSQTFDVANETNPEFIDIYKKFPEEFKPRKGINKIPLPNSITTTCLGISAISRKYPLPYCGGIWKVE